MHLSPSPLIYKFLSLLQNPPNLFQRWLTGIPADESSGVLEIIDHRTEQRYEVPITHNAIEAKDLHAISLSKGIDAVERMAHGLQVLDPGFQNTAVTKSSITLVYVLVLLIHGS